MIKTIDFYEKELANFNVYYTKDHFRLLKNGRGDIYKTIKELNQLIETYKTKLNKNYLDGINGEGKKELWDQKFLNDSNFIDQSKNIGISFIICDFNDIIYDNIPLSDLNDGINDFKNKINETSLLEVFNLRVVNDYSNIAVNNWSDIKLRVVGTIMEDSVLFDLRKKIINHYQILEKTIIDNAKKRIEKKNKKEYESFLKLKKKWQFTDK